MSSRWKSILAVLAIALLTAGCISGGPGGDAGPSTPDGPTPTTTPALDGTTSPTDAPPETPTTTPPETPTTTPPETPTTTPTAPPPFPSWEHAANQPDPNKSVTLENRWNRSVTMDVRVVRNATGATVHNASYGIAPGVEREVYNTGAANPDGIETFTIVVSARDTTDHVEIETNECYGNAYGEIADDGSLQVIYAIC